ncbi:MAG: peptidyl-prolyl cis-trans isomerase [Planctomycetota bacterium]
MGIRHWLRALPLLLLTAGWTAGGEPAESKKKEEGKGIEPVVATVNGQLITKYDIDWEMGYVEQMIRVPDKAERERQLAELRKIKIRDLVMSEVWVQAAKRAGIKITDRRVQQELRQQMKEKGGAASYYRLLAERGLTYAENWERLRRQLYIDDFHRRLVTSRTNTKFVYPFFLVEISVTPREVREYYERHPKEFEEDEPGIFRILGLKYEDFKTREAARNQADALRAQVAAAPDPEGKAKIFADLAKKHSFGEAAKGGGAMVLTMERTLIPELHKVLSTLKRGEISEPVKTEQGVFLLFLEKPLTKRTKPFEQVQRNIRELLNNRKWRQKIEDEQDRLVRQARIWPEKIARIVEERYGQ